MIYLKTYETYFYEFEQDLKYNFENQIPFNSDNILSMLIEGYIQNIDDPEIKKEIEEHWNNVNEGFDWIKKKGAEFTQELSKKSEKAWIWIKKKGEEALQLIKDVLAKMDSVGANILKNLKNKLFSSYVKSEEFAKKVKKTNQPKLKQELSDVKELVQFYTDKFIKLLKDATGKALVGLFGKKELVTEKVTVGKLFKKILSTVEKIPPFSWLNSIAHLAEKGFNKTFEGLSKLSKNLGGPEARVPLIAGLLGILFEYKFKGGFKAGVLKPVAKLLGADPAIGTFITVVSIIATVIAGIHAIDTLAGHKLLGAH